MEGFFTTNENKKKWSFKADLYQAIGRDKSVWTVHSISIFDLKNSKTYKYDSSNDSSKLKTSNNGFFIKYQESFMKGSYPNYKMKFTDPLNNINLDLKYTAISNPYWVAKQITDGWLPWGLGYFRYGFIPNNKIKGTFTVDNKTFKISGNGYFEHIWGDFSFYHLTSSKKSLKITFSTYTKLLGNWIHNQDIKIPKSIMLSTDNRPPGYDWIWSLMDNGWSIFFGNMVDFSHEFIIAVPIFRFPHRYHRKIISMHFS